MCIHIQLVNKNLKEWNILAYKQKINKHVFTFHIFHNYIRIHMYFNIHMSIHSKVLYFATSIYMCITVSQAWWLMFIIPSLYQSNIVSFRLVWITVWEPVFKNIHNCSYILYQINARYLHVIFATWRFLYIVEYSMKPLIQHITKLSLFLFNSNLY